MVLHSCEWCGNSFAPRTNGGKPQRFCSGDCRKQFHAACRLWGQDQVERGRSRELCCMSANDPGCVKTPANSDVGVNLSNFPKLRFSKSLI